MTKIKMIDMMAVEIGTAFRLFEKNPSTEMIVRIRTLIQTAELLEILDGARIKHWRTELNNIILRGW